MYDGDTVVGTVVAGEDGRWSFTPDTGRGRPQPEHHRDG
ncbi:hypothetical protein GHV20_006535 [Klebsiella oxytoca]